MPKHGLPGVLDWLRRRAALEVSCGELLEKFLAASRAPGNASAAPTADEAFAELVRRHGAKVYGVCRRILGDHQLAEDAFQATFVVLLRKASAVHPRAGVGGFLYGVARKAALEAFAVSRRRRETLVAEPPERVDCEPASPDHHDLALLDEEIANLSDAHRAALVLCEFDGVSRAQAAKQLGIAEGTLSSRLAAARKQLRKRLQKRGVALSAGLLTALAESGHAAAPLGLTATTAAITEQAVPPMVSLIAHGVLKTMVLAKLKSVTVFAAALVLASGMTFGLLATGTAGVQEKREQAADQKAAPVEPLAAKLQPRMDVHGDPLPPGALARLGTLRQRAADSHLAVSADGKDIITVGGAMTVRVWDAATGQLRSLRQLPETQSWTTTLSPHGKYLLRESFQPHQLAVWDVAAGKIAYTHLLSDIAMIEWSEFSTDERQVAISETKNDFRRNYLAIRIWDLASGQMRTLHEFDQQSYQPIVRFAPDGKRLVAHLNQNRLHCWDLSNGKNLWNASSHRYFCFTSDSKTIVRHFDDPLDAASGASIPWKVKAPEEWCPLSGSPDGRLVAFLTLEEELVLWEIATGKTVLKAPKVYRHTSGKFFPFLRFTEFAFMPDGKGFVWRPDVLQRWNIADGSMIFPDTREWGHTGAISRILFSPDGRLMASRGLYDRIIWWDIAAGRPLHAINGGFGQVMAFSPSGRHFLAPQTGKKVGLASWDVAARKVAGFFDRPEPNAGSLGGGGRELRVTADGRKILLLEFKNGRAGDECILTVWDFASGKSVRHERVPWVEESALTPDGESVLAFDSLSGDVVLRAVENAEPRWRLPLEARNPDYGLSGNNLVLSTDGRFMAARVEFYVYQTGQRKLGDIRVADMRAGRQLMKLQVDGDAHFAFSPDNRLFAVTAGDGVRFWEVASHKQVGFIPAPNRSALPPGEAFASALVFSPDSRTLATGHTDCTILLWDATFQGGMPRGPLSDAERAARWAELAGDDAAPAQAAAWRFLDDPAPSVVFLKSQLPPVVAAPREETQKWLKQLESDQFQSREVAEKQLRSLGNRAEPAMRAALKENPTLETSRRINAILAILDAARPTTNEDLRAIRAVQILERIESAESRQLLAELSGHARPTWFQRAAQESLDRQRSRSAVGVNSAKAAGSPP
jgi:RNA polymerase sigma factor (sigma-70 family)